MVEGANDRLLARRTQLFAPRQTEDTSGTGLWKDRKVDFELLEETTRKPLRAEMHRSGRKYRTINLSATSMGRKDGAIAKSGNPVGY